MRYFGYITDQAFKTLPDGTRIFYGPSLRFFLGVKPYILPDAETERRIFVKQLWLNRLTLGGMILGQALLFPYFLTYLLRNPLWFVAYLAAVLVVTWLISMIVFREELAKLSLTNVKIPRRVRYADFAAKHSVGQLLLFILSSYTFVVIGFLLLFAGFNPYLASSCSIFFGLCGIVFIKALMIKRSSA